MSDAGGRGILTTVKLDLGVPVPYHATAVRPTYADLPPAVRTEIAEHLGGTPAAEKTAGGGFGGGFAARLTAPDGRDLFVKAAGPHQPYVDSAYRTEAEVNRALPPGVPAPRLDFVAHPDDWIVLGFEAPDAVAPRLPLHPRDLNLMLDAWAHAAERLTPAPRALMDLGVTPMPTDGFSHFTRFASGRGMPPPLPDFAARRIDELAVLEQGLSEAIRADAVFHGDLRPDNMVVGAHQAWVCDWNMPNLAACWFDTALFLVVAHGDGHDSEDLFWRHPTAHGVEGEQLDAVLAAAAGYYVSNAAQPPVESASPYLRRHQRWNGLATLDWLASRRGW